eukprot:m.205057 g.205057  ORF g.205057 m.205057 type:complete len:211 (-) comp26041_c3_seq1:48-680(-)
MSRFFCFVFMHVLLWVYSCSFFVKYFRTRTILRASTREIKKCLVRASVEQWLVAGPLLLWIVWPLAQLRGMSLSSPLPCVKDLLIQLFFCLLIEDMAYPVLSRWLGYASRLLLQSVHVEWPPTGESEFKWLGWFESRHVIERVLAFYAGPMLLGVHVCIFWLFFLIRVAARVDGQMFPLAPIDFQADVFHKERSWRGPKTTKQASNLSMA